QRIDRFARNEYIELDEFAFLITRQMIIERGITPRNAFEPVVKIQHDLIQRQFVNQHYAILCDVFEFFLNSAFFVEQEQNAPEKGIARQDRRFDERLFDL